MEFNKYGMYSFILEIFTKKMETYHYPFVIMYFEFEKVSINLLKFATFTSLLNSPEKPILSFNFNLSLFYFWCNNKVSMKHKFEWKI